MKRLQKGLVVAACFTGIWIWNGLGASSQEAEKKDASKYGKYVLTTEI